MKPFPSMKGPTHALPTRSSFVFPNQLLLLVLICVLAGPVGYGCKNKKKLAEEQARQEQAQKQKEINDLRADLQSLMATPVRDLDDLADREALLNDIKNRNINDAGVLTLIKKAEYFLEQERKRLEAELAPPPPPRDPMEDLKDQLGQQFDQIARSTNLNLANSSIQQTMGMFSSPNAPVLVIISQENGKNDYDRPTTIEKYLNYIKDQRRNPNDIYNVVTDSYGKIKELELIKR